MITPLVASAEQELGTGTPQSSTVILRPRMQGLPLRFPGSIVMIWEQFNDARWSEADSERKLRRHSITC